MATVSHSAAVRPAFHFAGRGGLVDKYFYFAMSLLVAGIVSGPAGGSAES